MDFRRLLAVAVLWIACVPLAGACDDSSAANAIRHVPMWQSAFGDPVLNAAMGQPAPDHRCDCPAVVSAAVGQVSDPAELRGLLPANVTAYRIANLRLNVADGVRVATLADSRPPGSTPVYLLTARLRR